jgi:DNA-binding response OmpR family regulator
MRLRSSIWEVMAARALLISSDSNTISVLSHILAEMELAPEECLDIASAPLKISDDGFEVIVIDCPEQAVGDALARKARLSKVNQGSLLVTVVSAQSNVHAAFAAGANFVLYRPISPERARASVRAASHLIRRDKRRQPRMPVHAPATISYPSVESAPATLIDLSEDGLALQCEQRLPTRSKVYFRFNLPGQMRWIQLAGETVWQDSSGRAGIRFVQVPQFARLLLHEWLGSKASMQQSSVTVQIPLPGTSSSALSASDRREQARHACQLGTEVYRIGSSVPHRCHLTDISTGGCYVETPEPFPQGTQVEMMVRTEDFKFRSEGVVKVVHRGFGMGVEFASQTSTQKSQVQRLIKMVFQTGEEAPAFRF